MQPITPFTVESIFYIIFLRISGIVQRDINNQSTLIYATKTFVLPFANNKLLTLQHYNLIKKTGTTNGLDFFNN